MSIFSHKDLMISAIRNCKEESPMSLTVCVDGSTNRSTKMDAPLMMTGLPHGHDYWSSYPMPLTPPVSPGSHALPGQTHVTKSEATNGQRQEQPICGIDGDDLNLLECHLDLIESPPCSPAHHSSVNFASSCIFHGNSILIRDCMWSRDDESNSSSLQSSSTTESNALLGFNFDSPSSKLVSVDPAEIFPHSVLSPRCQSTTPSQSDSDEESDIDVVTVQHQSASTPSSKLLIRSPSSSQWHSSSKQLCQQNSNIWNDSGCSSGTDEDDINNSLSARLFSRASHNVLERKRRNELKQRFSSLKSSVPSLSKSDKVPKVTILKRAIAHIRTLKANETSLLKEINSLTVKQAKLKGLLGRLSQAHNSQLV